MMALTKPMNQPSAAKPEEWNLTRPEGEIPGWGERALSPSPCLQVYGLVSGPHLKPLASSLTTSLPPGTGA